MLDQLETLREQTLQDIAAAADSRALDEVHTRVLGRKRGDLTAILRNLKDLDADERPAVGQRANEVRTELENAFAAMYEELAARTDQGPALDLTLPGRRPRKGHLHVLTQTRMAMDRIFSQMGYKIATGPQVESDYYNFEALNLPANHPARDMQDTFYIEGGLLLRTHTSPVQIRTMERLRPPIRIFAPGITFRRDDDPTHSPQFMQVEGLVIDEGVTFGDLKGTIEAFVHAMFGKEIGVRFRPSFFPFTEPSAEVDMQCTSCGGTGCRVCGQTGWLEIMGCGMVDPAVFAFVDYDPEVYTGFAFGMGIERIAMIRHAIDDMRLLYENNVRFLEQF